jgi:hypothetical protein
MRPSISTPATVTGTGSSWSKTFGLSDSDRHGRIFTVKALSVDWNKFLHMASPQIQPPECYGPNIVSKFIYDELQHVGAVRVCWQVFEASSTRILTCAMFDASGPGVELRICYFRDLPLRSQMMPDIESARVLAKDWLDVVRAAAAEDN